jgi:two-component sensor histidine kinase
MKKRLFAVAATALLPVTALLVYNEISSRRERSAEIHAQAAQAAHHAALEVERILEGARSLLIAVSALPAVMDLQPQSCSSTLQRVADGLSMTGAILVFDTRNRLVCDSQGNPPGIDFSERDYVSAGLTSTDMVVGEYTVSKLSGAAVLPVAMALKRNGTTVGVVATGIKLDWLQARLMERVASPGSAVTLADRNAVIIARQPLPERFVGKVIPDSYRHLLTAGEPGTIELKSQDGTERILGYRPITREFPIYVSAGFAKEEAFAAINRLTWAAGAMLLLSTLLAAAAALHVGTHFILRPIEHIIGVIERWRHGELASRTRMAGAHGELGLVGGAVDDLLDELDMRAQAAREAEEQRNLLVGELGHRMKNTLAVISAIARQTFRDVDPRVDEFLQRLAALSRAYDQIFAVHEEGSDIRSVVEAALAPYVAANGSQFRIEGPFAPIPADVGMALTLITHELATNATKYGALSVPGGQIRIFWQGAPDRLFFGWHEEGGPPVETPRREGFGSKLVRRALPATYHPELTLSFAEEGLKFELYFDAAVSQHP